MRAGDRLSEGPVNPHDILRIKGPRAVQEYLLNEVQEVYRLQGVKINDKHIGVIVRQMLQKVRVLEAGDTEFLEGEHVDKQVFRDENDRVKKKKETPSTAEPLLLGITKASLTTQSFISAASFQETTRVLTDASIRGAKDDLLGLKENIIIGHLIPAGTGMYRYQEVELEGMEMPAPPEIAPLPEALPNVFAMADEEDFPASSAAGRAGRGESVTHRERRRKRSDGERQSGRTARRTTWSAGPFLCSGKR